MRTNQVAAAQRRLIAQLTNNPESPQTAEVILRARMRCTQAQWTAMRAAVTAAVPGAELPAEVVDRQTGVGPRRRSGNPAPTKRLAYDVGLTVDEKAAIDQARGSQAFSDWARETLLARAGQEPDHG